MLGKASTGKFRFAIVETDEEWHEPEHGYIIQRSYGQVKGKTTLSPAIIIKQTKQKRTWREQLELQYNSEVKKFLDKGYVEVDKHPNEYSEEELDNIFGEVKTNQYGVIKPMLAKQAKDIKNLKIFDKEYYISRKINGVRCLIYYDGNQVKTSSRGATNYDIAIYHIITHPLIETFFKNHPDAILDGEIFKKNLSLNIISGICRSQKTINDGKNLQFYWYDIVDLQAPFSKRWNTMQEWSKELQLSDFDPDKQFSDEELHIQFLPQEKISGWNNMKKLHDKWVQDGWEGAELFPETKPSQVLQMFGSLSEECAVLRKASVHVMQLQQNIKPMNKTPKAVNKMEREQNIVNMYIQGYSIKDIFAVSGFSSRGSVFRILNKYGVTLNRKAKN